MTTAELVDVGAQAERTALAWQRTGLGLMAIGALLLRWDVTQRMPVWPGIMLTVAAGLIILILVPNRYRRVLHVVRAGENPLSRAMVPAATALTVVVILGIAAELAVRLVG